MQRKSETFGKFKEILAEAERQLGKSLLCLRSDRGGEYLDTEFKDHLIEHGIVSSSSTWNATTERRGRKKKWNNA